MSFKPIYCVLFLITLLSACSGSGDAPPQPRKALYSRLVNPPGSTGKIGLYNDGSLMVDCFAELEANGSPGKICKQAWVGEVESGVKVSVKDDSRAAKVRILEGKFSGQEVYVPSAYIEDVYEQ